MGAEYAWQRKHPADPGTRAGDYEFKDTMASLSMGLGSLVAHTPSHHQVHHGTNSEYLDRNHGSILIIWDKLFGTFEPENARPVYGLTTNIDTFNPLRIAGHEWADMLRDVASADTWQDRWSHLLRKPGWSYARRKTRLATAA